MKRSSVKVKRHKTIVGVGYGVFVTAGFFYYYYYYYYNNKQAISVNVSKFAETAKCH